MLQRSLVMPLITSPLIIFYNPKQRAMPSSKFAMWNMRGFHEKSKERDMLSFSQTQDIDIFFLQEANFRSPVGGVTFRRDLHVDAFFSLTNSRACGVGIIFVSGRLRQRLLCAFGANGRMLLLDVYTDGKRVRFVNLYAHVTRSDTNSFYKELHKLLLGPLPQVLLGDFYCVVDSQRDVKGPGRGESTYHAKEFLKTLRHLNLTDASVHLHSDHFVPTRTSKTTASRIDRTYLPDYLLPSVVAWEVLVLPNNLAGKSEHPPLATTVRGCPGLRKCNLSWRLDPTLLQDKDCVQRLGDCIQGRWGTPPKETRIRGTL
ncbi:hypothetical protein HPB52_023794 [Rhipicephalus sanguineus]|uniref:Endonuclease/exonuclease/phosphatase domain-containing protein n=1 Tax=Rhipicephalus sanguineus TaxID=34632 RepID=A0A9D4Q3Z6_RHISA|nr:hypothetical protein HPB52_023794 [Rhipicephalus sanguineus]